jgi:hypothetical protein
MKKLSRSLALACVCAAAGCAGSNGVSVVENQESGFFSSSEYAHDINDHLVLVRVAGTAFNQRPQDFTNTVVQDMQGADWSPHARFTAESGPNTARIYSYAMMFGGSRDITDANLCASIDAPTAVVPGTGVPRAAGMMAPPADTSGNTTLIAALCRYDKATMGVTARVANAAGPNDPKFRSLVRSAVLELTRPNQDNIQHDRDNGSDESTGGSGGQR